MVLAQDWPGPLEIVLAVGPSSDRTEQIALELAGEDDRIVVVENPSGRTPDALNAAVAAARGEIIVRVDGHAEIPGDYISVAVEVLERTGADNVGGIMDAQGVTPFQRAVACAMKSPLGVGNSRFHVGGDEGPTETVYLGVFRRAAIERVGGFDAHYTRAQDWEMNHRIRQTGGIVYFTPDLRVVYRPRSSIKALARQYLNYGRWRRVVSRNHRGTINLRYLAPPVMVAVVGAASACAVADRRALLVPGTYLAFVGVGGVVVARREPLRARLLTPFVMAIMHWSWGVGFLTSPRGLAEKSRYSDPSHERGAVREQRREEGQ